MTVELGGVNREKRAQQSGGVQMLSATLVVLMGMLTHMVYAFLNSRIRFDWVRAHPRQTLVYYRQDLHELAGGTNETPSDDR